MTITKKSAKKQTTAAVTFELYPLVAVSSAQTVPVDYACAA